MHENISEIRVVSAKLKPLLEARQEVGRITYINVRENLFLQDPLKEFLTRVDQKIESMKSYIKSAVCKIDGYDPQIHRKVDYITSSELRDNVLDISKNMDGSYILDLIDFKILKKIN